MEFQYHLRKAKKVKYSMSLKELQTMLSKTIAKCMPKDILTKFKHVHPLILAETKHLLPAYVEVSGHCGEYKTHNYSLWAKYVDHPYMSANLLEDGECAKEWLSAQAPLFNYEQMTTHPWLDKLLVEQGEVIFFQSHALTHNISPLHAGRVHNAVDLYSLQAILDLDKKHRYPEKAQGGKRKSRCT
ncbi:hypothetical protein BGX38DRAFT_1221142 [Terfezia claveryi]|nr:hypothetical protein BGX38DRAFT_1221142 [Terfezia claveryi]